MATVDREVVLYEIAMSIGNSLDIQLMSKAFLSTVLKKLPLSSGFILKSNVKMSQEDIVFSIPKRISNNHHIMGVIHAINSGSYASIQMTDGLIQYIFKLEGFGYLVLFSTVELEPLIVKSFDPLLQKLTISLLACENHAALQESLTLAQEATYVKSVFLANMSHEIRTPMNAVIGMTGLALEGELNEKQKSYILKANLSAKNLLGIINDILDFSKIEAGKLELSPVHFELKDVIAHTLQVINADAREKGVKTRVQIGKDVPRVYYADSLRLTQVLTNLVNNAVKFSHHNGSILVSVSLKEKREKDVLVEFSVADKGIGISPENQRKLFQTFSQAESSTTRKYGGTGLGLAISKKIVEIMGGQIGVQSRENEGSVFRFTVSMQVSDESFIERVSQRSKKGLQTAVAKLEGVRVLLVEDNLLNQELAHDLLVNNGLEVSIAEHGRDALEILQTQEFDVILMDCQMPVMDGYEATRQIRAQEKYKDLPILAMTANVMSEDIDKALEAGMNDNIAKPINPQVMFETIAKWI